jgi:beta-phosphoglucomutase-like phosphatase (HAD superfamily)
MRYGIACWKECQAIGMKKDFSRYQWFFFDFDGVIADSVHIKTEAFADLFREYGPKVVRQVVTHHKNNGGISRYEKFKYYYSNFLHKPISDAEMKRLDRRLNELVLDKVVNCPLIPGVIEFLAALHKARKRCFVVSGTPQKEMRRIVRLKRLLGFFAAVTGSPTGKTTNLRSLMRRFHADPKRSVYFGDAKSDLEAAQTCGIEFIGVVNYRSCELRATACVKTRDFLGFSVSKDR